MIPGGKMRSDFSSEFRAHSRMVELFSPLISDKNYWLIYGDHNNLAKAKAAFKEINVGCTGKYKEITDDPRAVRFNQPLKQYKTVWCALAAKGDEIVNLAVKNMLAGMAQEVEKSFIKQAKNLDSSKGHLRDWNEQYYFNPDKVKTEISAKRMADMKFVGWSKPPADAFSRVDKALADLLQKIEAKMPDWQCEPDGTPKADGFVVKEYKKAFPGVKIVKNYSKSKTWKVTKNHRGVLLHRSKQGMIVFKLPKEKWCRSHQYVYIQDRNGNRWAKTRFEHARTDTISKLCSCP